MIKTALISVSDKTGAEELAGTLHDLGVEIVSTGGTAEFLKSYRLPVTSVADLTGFPEMMDGRVKTLHPKIHGGLLALRDHPSHMSDAAAHGVRMIDLVAVNLYPFEATIQRDDVSLETAIENIDIGGPAMIRSASKNYRHVIVLVDPGDYTGVLEELRTQGGVSEATRFRLMVKAFEHTAHYDALIANYFADRRKVYGDEWPERIVLSLDKGQSLRYGENPHQKASFYFAAPHRDLRHEQLHGKELSYNNLMDLDACARVVSEFDKPCCVIVKHTNPCGGAVHDDLYRAYLNARETDPVSAFGGVIGFNRPLNARTAHDIAEVFVEAILAPDFEPAALEVLRKKKNVRLIRYDFSAYRADIGRLPEVRKALDGYLVQQTDTLSLDPSDSAQWRVVTRRAPSPSEKEAMLFGWKIVTHVKSNAIVYCASDRTLGIGAGQMSRVDASEIAVWKAQKSGLSLKGAVAASDAFFPFRDGVDAAAKAGATAVIQPGGSVKDEEIIAAANEHDLAMVFTSVRHFRH
jgi:phosphoribosylaminoimidazolecarboxamide formyltransferase/IMP cyclohydrolase